MEPLQGDTVTNDSCSCTTHDYNSESDCQTLIRLLSQGCRINRLFNGKYIPLRESKLLDRLIRTRALYDALRNELLSNSLSVSSTGIITPGQDSTENTNSLEAKKTGDIFDLVELVDKGAVLGSRKLRVSCSCCNCNSKAHLHENMQKVRRNRQTHTGANLPSRSSVTSKQGSGEELKLGKQFKAKNIKSDPCTCASKLEEIIKSKLQSRTILKKNRHEQPQGRDQFLINTDKHKTLTTNNDKMKISYHKLKRYRVGPTQYSENMGEGGIATIGKLKPYQDNLELKKMSSIEQLKLAQQKIKDSYIADLKATRQSKPEGDSLIKNNAANSAFFPKNNPALKLAQQKIKDSFIADLKATQQSKPEGDSMIKNNAANSAFFPKMNPAIKFHDKVIGIDQLQDRELQKNGRIFKKNYQDQNDGKNINISGPPNLGNRTKQYLMPGRTADKRYQSPIRRGDLKDPSHQDWELQKDGRILKKNDLVQNGGRNLNISGPPNFGIRKEQYPMPGRIAEKRHQSPIIKVDKNDPSHLKGNKNAPSHQKGPKNYPLYQKRNKNYLLNQKRHNEPSHLKGNKNEPSYQKGHKNEPSHEKGNKNDPSHQKGKVISKTFHKVTHAIANSMKLQKPKQSEPLVLHNKKSMALVKSNLDVPNKQYINHKRLDASQQKSPPKKRNQNQNTLEGKVTKKKGILKRLNNGIAVSIKQQQTTDGRSHLDKRYNKQSIKSAKSMSSIKPNVGVRKEQFTSPVRISTKQQKSNEQYANAKRIAANQQKSPPRKQNKSDTLDEKENIKLVKNQISKSFHKLAHIITTSIKPQKIKESYPSIGLRDNRKSKSMTLLQSPEIVNRMENPPLNKVQEKKPIKSKTKRKPGKFLKAMSTTSIEKLVVENEDQNVQTITKKRRHLFNNENKTKSDPSIQTPRSITSDAPMRFKPKEHSSKKLLTQHEENDLQNPDGGKESENDRQKKKKKKNKQSKNHALKRCLCSLKIKVKKTKSALSKIVAGEKPQVRNKQSANILDSKTHHETLNASNCECSDIDMNITQKRGSNNELRQAITRSKTKLSSNDTAPKIKNALDKTISSIVVSDTKEKKSIFSHVTECKCPFIKENMMSTHLLNCECSDTDMNINQERGSENKLRQENTHSTNKSSSSHTISNGKNHPIHISTPHKSGKRSLALRDRRKITTPTFCECSDTSLSIKQNSESNNQLQVNTHSTTNATTSDAVNHPAHINSPNKTISLSAASECECFHIIEKVSLKYKQTNTHNIIKSTKHASTETKEKVNIQNHSVQTINTETITGKQSRKLETKSILSRVARCKCIIAKKEKPSEKQEMSDDYNSKPRFGAKFSKNASKDRLKISLGTDSINKRTDWHINKGSTKIKKIQNIQSKLSNSNDQLTNTSAKHGLQRCFCTLKLGKFDKKRNKLRQHFKGAISNANLSKSEYPETQPQVGISISTERREIYHREPVLSKREARKLKKRKKVGKNRSNYSLTSRSMQLPRSQKMSILVSHKSEIPTNTTQQVRSSFATKYLHKNRSLATYSLIEKDSQLKRDRTMSAFNHSLQKDEKRLQKSLRNLKRCLCTLKIHKKDKRRKKNIAVSTDSKTKVEKMYPETKSPIKSPIDIGIETQKIKMKSKSSDTRKLSSSSNLLFINSEFKQQQCPLRKLKNLKKHTESHHRSKQTVELGSNFSFKVEFYKDVIPENQIIVKRLNNISVYFSNNSQEVKQLNRNNNRKSCLKTPKITVVHSVSKSSLTIKERRDDIMTPLVIKRPTSVYTTSTVTVAQTKTNLPDISNLLKEVKLDPRCVDSYIAKCTEKIYNRKKQWEYLKNRSISSVFSIKFKSKKIQSYIDDSKCNLFQMNSLNQSLLDFTSKETVRFESKLGYQINYEENINFNRRPILRSTYSESDSFAQKQDLQKVLGIQETEESPMTSTNPPELTGIQPFLKRCYCAMNVQVAQQSPKRRHHQHYSRKLKDYECEPGVCIPYECDPNECQKMIMKRLMRKVSRMSGTENRMKSSSSATSSMVSSGRRSRKLQSTSPEPHYRERRYHKRPAKVRYTGLKYETLPRSPIKQRQAVRVGSNFSFNVEFSKGSSKSAPTAHFIKEPLRPSTSRSSRTPYRRRRHRGTGYEVGRHHRESQSTMKQMRHRGSSVTPMLRRCFCTLKLQKKGRQQKERELEMIHQGTSTPPKFYVDKPILRTTETSQNTKVRRRFPELLPYECEPNVCVPGQCDPYECLELIKKRRGKHTRDWGTDSIKSNLTSSSSMTSSQRRTRRRYVQARNLNQTRSRDTVVRSPTLIEKQVSPTKQAVRISSSFSFNVEFFKDKTSPTDDIDMRSPEIYEHRTPRYERKVPKHVYTDHRIRESSSQYRKPTRDTPSQMGLIKHGRSTMTGAFLKRCFCTAKLQSAKVDTEPKASENHTSLSVMKRCLCHLKSLTTKKEPTKTDKKEPPKTDKKEPHKTDKKEPHKTDKKEPPKMDKKEPPKTDKKEPHKTDKKENEQITPLIETHVGKTQTHKARAYSPVLEPYECEPGVCVPGLCDPYECEKRIRKRRMKEKMAGTTRLRTKSTSSSVTSSMPSRARMTQSKRFRQYERRRRRHLPPRDIVVRDRTPVLPQRQAVKIGSNFSFNIEFYKDKMPNLPQVQTAVTPVRRPRPTRDQAHNARNRYKTRDRRLMGRTSSVYTRGSQMDAIKTKDQSLGPILKRCFCTLKLLNKEKYIRKEKQMDQGTRTPAMKEVPTLQSRSVMTIYKYKPQHYKLKPYECEPGVCVPGECDPFECDKRIKRRLMHRESGTLTDRYGTRSTASTIRPHRRYRDHYSQSMRSTRPVRTRDIQHRARRPEMRRKVVERTSKSAVNIGSNFSFNMEFFKDKSPDGSILSSRPKKYYDSYERPRRTASRSSGWQSPSRNKKAQHYSTMHDMDSQVFAPKMRSTMTGVGPFLKRCFCTLQLHKSEKDKKPFNRPEPVPTKTENFKIQPKVETRHENTSTSARSPVQFQTSKLEPYECEPGVCVPGECDPYECEKRIKRRLMQSKQSSTDPHRGRSVSSSIGESTLRHQRIQATSFTPSGERVRVRDEDHVSATGGSPNRQVVRIGSSFSFNVEFYKDQSPQLPSARDVTKIVKRGYKGTETQHRHRNASSYSRRPHTRHCKSQSDCVQTDCKSSCTPLLKRCFCTLKLHKMGKLEEDYRTMRTMGTLTRRNKVEIVPVAREIGTKTKRYAHPLKPYECEPGVCVPGLCDPYECDKRIKQRNMKDFATGMTGVPMKSMYSLTSRDMGTKAMNTYRSKNRKPHTEPVYKTRKSPRIGNGNRQSVHFGSNFSFNMEFFKDHGGMQHDDIQAYHKPRAVRTGRHKSKTSISTAHRIKLRNQGSRARETSLYHRQLQAGAQTESRGSGMGALKRCFCTLTLQRAEVKNNLNSPVAKQSMVSTQDKKTSTRKYAPTPVPYKLKPYECEPNVCTPGECDPYECLERIKKRGIRRMSRTTGTRMKRTSQISASSMAAPFMPGYSSKRTQLKTEGYSPQKVQRIVEEPRFSFLNGSPNRHGVKISSNFSINIEFYKEASTPTRMQAGKTCQNKETCQVKDVCTKCKKTGHTTSMRVGKHGTRNYLHNNESQADTVKTEDKSSTAAILKRCFCTAKLHRSHLARSHYPQSVTVGRVEEIRPLFGPKEYWVQYQIQPSKKTRSEVTKDLPNMKSSGSNKLETIMSYAPRKFIKNNDAIEQSLMCKKTEASTSTVRKMLKYCKNLFIRHNYQNERVNANPTEVKLSKQPRIDFLKTAKSERHPDSPASTAIKKSKSMKVTKTSEYKVHKTKYSRFESGDANHGHTAGIKSKRSVKFVIKTCPKCHVQLKKPMPLKQVHFALSPKVESLKSVMESPKESKSVSLLYKASTFRQSDNLKCPKLCSCCGGLKREKHLLSLDFNTTNFMVYNAVIPKEMRHSPQENKETHHKPSCPCCTCRKRATRNKTVKLDTNVTTEKQHPNVTTTVKQYTNLIMTGNQHTNLMTAKQDTNEATLNLTNIPRKNRYQKRQPCVCGSTACKKEAEKLADEQYLSLNKPKIKKCVCGTDICGTESKKEALVKQSGYKEARKRKRKQKNKELEAKLRDITFKKKDKEIMRRRKLNDKYMMKQLKKYKETSDVMLLTESLLDICKLGITSASDIVRSVGRTVIDPKRTYRNVLMAFKDPMRTWKKFQDAASDGPGIATLKRIKLRCQAMTCTKRGREKLESHPVTNYLLHVNDKDPRRRLNPKKIRQPRRDGDFKCSPFMLSLRKRPWLSVYYTCTWFYPHCLSLLQVWRQFMDVILFVLAVAVWSPCIVCMEMSRALMCCFLCTG